MRTVSSRLFLFVALLGLGVGGSLAATSSWQIDPAHSAATFSVRHLMISNVKGEFSKVTGVVNLDEQDITKSTVEVAIDVNTLNTREADRDKHLRTADFFDVQNFPTMTFRSKRVEQVAPGKLKVTGDLTIRGVTHEATFDVDGPTPAIKDPWGNTRAAVSATAHVNRQDFGLKWNAKLDNGGVVVGDDVTVTMDVEFIRKAPPATRK